jgi:hypothetical protein
MKEEINHRDAQGAKKYGWSVGGYVIPAEAGIQSLLTDWQRPSKRDHSGLLTPGATFFHGNDALGREIDRTVESISRLRGLLFTLIGGWFVREIQAAL